MKCKHTHKDAPDNAICEDCYSSSGNSEGFRSSKKSRSRTENPDKFISEFQFKKRQIDQIRKQTAEEIFKELEDNHRYNKIYFDYCFDERKFNEIKKKYLGGLK